MKSEVVAPLLTYYKKGVMKKIVDGGLELIGKVVE